MTPVIKFGICVVIGLIGFSLVMGRSSIPAIIIGFLMVAAVVPSGHYFWAQLHAPKNPLAGEIEALLAKHKKDDK